MAMIRLFIFFVIAVSRTVSFDGFAGLEVSDDSDSQTVTVTHPNAAPFPKLEEQSAKDRWTAAAIAAREAGPPYPQGQVDVLQIIYNRIASGEYNCKTVNACVVSKGQFQPTFPNPNAWKAINSAESAARASKVELEIILEVDQTLQNPQYQLEAARFIECRTDFMGESQKKNMKPERGDITRGEGHNYFGNFWPASGNGDC